MRSERSLLGEIQEAIGLIDSYAGDRDEAELRTARMRRDAICMRLIVIGEAANRLSTELKAAHSDVNWRGVIALRHLLAHDYGSADDAILWRIVSEQLPDLGRRIDLIVASL